MRPGGGAPGVELNLDGLVGPTHNYAGLSAGNLASQANRAAVANPREAALQGIAKMRLLAGLGVPQGVLPPHERPDVEALRRLGFTGTDAAVLAAAAARAPDLLAACSSASAMWAANAATVTASADAADGRVHVTPANLVANLHRALETPTTARVLRAVLPGDRFVHHDPLPAAPALGDEGAANHMGLCPAHGAPGLEAFVYGRRALGPPGPAPARHPARQTREAAAALARLGRLDDERALLVQQHPDAIDAGAFHNDVVAVSCLGVLLCHERAYVEQALVLAGLREAYARLTGEEAVVLEVPERRVSLGDAVRSYLFNSQLVATAGSLTLVVPAECREVEPVRRWLDDTVGPGAPIARWVVADVRQSMRNGGGPACLRLRLPLTAPERAAVAPGVLMDAGRLGVLEGWVRRHYRDRLGWADLADPALLDEGRAALDELTRILGLGPLYAFQR